MSSSPRLSRRALIGAGALGGVAVLTGCGGDSPDSGSATHPSTPQWIDHLGAHQPGVITPVPEHAVIAAFDTTAADIGELLTLLQALADQTDQLTSHTIPASTNDLLPPVDNGILGTVAEPGDLTITVDVVTHALRRLMRATRASLGPAVHLLPAQPGHGFVAVQKRLDGEALEEYIRPIGGGFFFVPPGRRAAGEPFAAALLA
jgi:deferrochelatase/peroxidase EfeB